MLMKLPKGENEDEVASVVSAAEVTEESEMLLAALTGTDKAKLPCFAHFKAQRIHTESGTIEISDNTGCVRGADCQYSHDVRDKDIVAKFASAISQLLGKLKAHIESTRCCQTLISSVPVAY